MSSPGKVLFYIYNVQEILFLAVFFIGICYYLNLVWKKRHLLVKSWNYQGPFTLPLIGIPHILICKRDDLLERFTKVQEKYPTGGKTWFGNMLTYYLHEPEHIRKILGSGKFVTKEHFIYKFFKVSDADGIFTAPAEKWKKCRRIIVQSFNQQMLNSFVEVFARKSLIINKDLDENYRQELDFEDIFARCAFDMTCENAMDTQSDVQRTKPNYAHVIDSVVHLWIVKVLTIWYHIEIIWKIFGCKQEQSAYTKKFTNFADQVIQQKIETIKEKKNSAVSDNEVLQKRVTFLNLIIENDEFSEKGRIAEVQTLLLAATHTSSSALTFIFAMLGMFPAIQENIFEEVTQIMGKDRSPEVNDLSLMVYTERVIKETLRIFPTVPIYLRAITEDIDMGDFVVPKGASAFFGLMFIHRNPKYWPDPLKFDPDRFLPEEVAKRHPCTFIPFSYGPRNCLGMKYGMMSMKVVIATVIRKFIIHCAYKKIEDIRLKYDFVLKFKDGAKVSVTPRQ